MTEYNRDGWFYLAASIAYICLPIAENYLS